MKMFFIALVGIILSACSMGSMDVGSLLGDLAPKGTNKDRETVLKEQKQAICEWGSRAGMPHSGAGDVRRSIAGNQSVPSKDKKAFLDYYKRVTATSVAYECTCGDEARQKVLKCDALEAPS